MNSKRIPFQFTSLDPVKRQAELRKRFGLPTNDMIDFMNPNLLGAESEDSLSTSEKLPREVPTFSHGSDIKSETMKNADGHKPKVRVIPIQVEGVDESIRCQRFFGPARSTGGTGMKAEIPKAFSNGSSKDSANAETAYKPGIRNIPIQIEPRDKVKELKVGIPEDKLKSIFQTNNKSPVTEKKIEVQKVNGCAASCEQPLKPENCVPLKQIETVLNKLKTYHEEVEKFTGTAKDKQYRYLDEMLTRCMLDLDNVDTLGLNEVRLSRKAAVKQVQASIDYLEQKINMTEQNLMEAETLSTVPTQSSNQNIESIVPPTLSDNSEIEMCKVEVEKTDIVQDVPTGDVVQSQSGITSQTVPVENSDNNELSADIEIQELESINCDELDNEPIVPER